MAEQRKTISKHAITVQLEGVAQGEYGEGVMDRVYRLIITDPDFLTEDVVEQGFITIEVLIEKKQEADGTSNLFIDVDTF